MAQHSGIQSGESVAKAGTSSRHRRLVADQFAAAGGKDWRPAGQTCAVLLADAGRGTLDENTVLGDVPQDRVVAASGKLADRPQCRESESRRAKEDG